MDRILTWNGQLVQGPLKPIDLGVHVDTGGSEPTVFGSETFCDLIFYLFDREKKLVPGSILTSTHGGGHRERHEPLSRIESGSPLSAWVGDDPEPMCVTRFVRPVQYCHGANLEALDGITPDDDDFEILGAYHVETTAPHFGYVFLFNDSQFECIAEGLVSYSFLGTMSRAARDIASRVAF